jgi:hypothetical protein
MGFQEQYGANDLYCKSQRYIGRSGTILLAKEAPTLHLFVTNPSYFLHTSQSYFKCDLIQDP